MIKRAKFDFIPADIFIPNEQIHKVEMAPDWYQWEVSSDWTEMLATGRFTPTFHDMGICEDGRHVLEQQKYNSCGQTSLAMLALDKGLPVRADYSLEGGGFINYEYGVLAEAHDFGMEGQQHYFSDWSLQHGLPSDVNNESRLLNFIKKFLKSMAALLFL